MNLRLITSVSMTDLCILCRQSRYILLGHSVDCTLLTIVTSPENKNILFKKTTVDLFLLYLSISQGWRLAWNLLLKRIKFTICNRIYHRGSMQRPIHSSSSPKLLLQNVISGIFLSSSHRVYRLEIANSLRTIYVGFCYPALGFVRSRVAHLPFSLVQHSPLYTVYNGGGGVSSCVGEHILQDFFLLCI